MIAKFWFFFFGRCSGPLVCSYLTLEPVIWEDELCRGTTTRKKFCKL